MSNVTFYEIIETFDYNIHGGLFDYTNNFIEDLILPSQFEYDDPDKYEKIRKKIICIFQLLNKYYLSSVNPILIDKTKYPENEIFWLNFGYCIQNGVIKYNNIFKVYDEQIGSYQNRIQTLKNEIETLTEHGKKIVSKTENDELKTDIKTVEQNKLTPVDTANFADSGTFGGNVTDIEQSTDAYDTITTDTHSGEDTSKVIEEKQQLLLFTVEDFKNLKHLQNDAYDFFIDEFKGLFLGV